MLASFASQGGAGIVTRRSLFADFLASPTGLQRHVGIAAQSQQLILAGEPTPQFGPVRIDQREKPFTVEEFPGFVAGLGSLDGGIARGHEGTGYGGGSRTPRDTPNSGLYPMVREVRPRLLVEKARKIEGLGNAR